MLTLRRAFAALTVVLLGMSGAVGASLMEGSRAWPAGPKNTTTTVTSSGTPSLPGATVVFTATVQRNGAGTTDPTSGWVTFYDGATAIGFDFVDSTHTASFSTSSLSMGSHSITGEYSGNFSFDSSVSPVFTQVVSLKSTSTTVTSNNNPSQLGQSVTFTASVTSSSGTPTGTVAFADGGVTITGCATRPLAAGVATCTTSALTLGSHAITAGYSGAATFSPSTSVALTQWVSTIATATALSADVNPSTYGDVVTFAAVVSASGGPAPTSGTVTFYDGLNIIGSDTVDSSAVATLSIGSFSAGNHDIKAVYGGIATHASSTSAVSTQVVAKAGTATSVSFALNPSVFGDPVTFTATVSPNPGDGTVQFTIDGADFGAPVPVNGSGEATSGAISNLTVGDHAIAATYSGGANHNGSTGQLTQTVEHATTTTAIESDANPSVYGDAVTFTATVSSGAGVPTGSVVFQSDGATIPGCGSETLDAGVATCTTDTLGAGAHAITADYSGSDNYTASSATALTQTVDAAATSTQVLADLNPSTFGDSVTFTATVTGVPNGEIPTGTVQFTIDGVAAGAPATLAAGSASLVVSDLDAGDHTIAATYSGSANYTGSTDSTTQTVEPAATSTVVDADANPSVYGDAVTFTATVSDVASVGTVQFSIDGTDFGAPVAVDADGEAHSDATSSLGAGDHEITATFSGSDNYTASSATALTQTVDAAATSTQVLADLNPSTFGDSVTFTATVTGVPNGEIPTGTVQFTIDGVAAGAPATLAAGSASLVVSDLDAGDHTIAATYSGSANYTGSTDSTTQTVEPAATSTVVDADANPSVYGDAVTFTATVSDVASVGTVQFSIDGTDFGAPVAVAADGEAHSDATSSLGAGDHEITATFSGTANYDGSAGTLTQTVTRADTTTTVVSDGSPSMFGDDVTFTATVSPAPASGSVQFSIDGSPSGAPVALTAGAATLIGSGLSSGTHQIDAAFLGSANYKPSSGTVAQPVSKRASTTALANTPAVPKSGTSVTLQATITGGGPVPGGTVQFSVDGSPMGSPVALSGTGIASRTITAPSAGVHTVTALYSGSLAHLTSSATATITVAAAVTPPPVEKSGYWMVGLGGAVYAFGDVPYKGGTNVGDVADIEPTKSGEGYWILTHNGTLLRFGDAPNFGDARTQLRAGERAVSMSATPTNNGYWIFTDIGRALPFGGAQFLGDMSAVRLNGPVLGSISTPSGHGYYMVASDGGVFSFGDAAFHGSMGSVRLNQPVMGLVPDHDNVGYWLVARDGGVFAFDAPFRGSMGSTRLNKPVIGMVGFGVGYLMVAEDGGIFNFSDKPFRGSLGSNPPALPIVSVASHSEP